MGQILRLFSTKFVWASSVVAGCATRLYIICKIRKLFRKLFRFGQNTKALKCYKNELKTLAHPRRVVPKVYVATARYRYFYGTFAYGYASMGYTSMGFTSM